MASTWSYCPSGLMVIYAIVLICALLPGTFSANVITLQSIMIFTTHDWLPLEPTIYFRCQGENLTILPDVKETNLLYSFKGEESWQPLTVLRTKKCKRCGLYERDAMRTDESFDEWELCPGDFFNGTSVHFKTDEFNATFRSTFNESSGFSETESDMNAGGGIISQLHVRLALIVIGIALVSILIVVGSISGYKYWQKRKRERDQARFLKIFEEGDDLDEELGMGSII